MKVLLVNPPTFKDEVWVREGRCQQLDVFWSSPFTPLSLAYIAGQIKDSAETLIIDSPARRLSVDETIKKVKDFSPDLLVMSSATPTIKNDLGLFAESVKKIVPAVKIAAIGIHATALPKETLLEFPGVDFVVCGEPEMTVKELVSALIQKSSLDIIKGLGFRREKEIILNPKREFLDNLDELGSPIWPGVDFSNYKMPIIDKPFNLIVITRGCPFNCKFCASHAYYGKKVRKRSAKKIVEDLEENVKKGIYDFLFWTELITFDKEYLGEVLDAIKAAGLHKKIRWATSSRVDFVDEDILKKLKEAGCWQIVFGLEFGNNQILKLAQKGGKATVEQGRKAVEEAARVGLVTDGHFVLGYPGETEDTLRDTINFAISLPLTFAHFYIATPFPGSCLYDEALKNDWLIAQDWSQTHQNAVNLKTEFLEPKTVEKFISLAYRRFYLRPQIILRIARIAKNPRQFFNISKLGLFFVYNIFKNAFKAYGF